jgi:hypothetical protein
MFRVGDVVICNDAERTVGGLTKDKEYVVLRYENGNSEVLYVIDDHGSLDWFLATRFGKVEKTTTKKSIKLDLGDLKDGDVIQICKPDGKKSAKAIVSYGTLLNFETNKRMDSTIGQLIYGGYTYELVEDPNKEKLEELLSIAEELKLNTQKQLDDIFNQISELKNHN